jgi:hypothetical protein
MHQVGRAWSLCARPCGQAPGATVCAEDEFCHEGACRARCSFDKPYPCLAQFCVGIDGKGTGVCLSSPEAWRSDPGWPRR